MSFQVQKYEKYLKSKNELKRPQRAFIKELWAIYDFLKSGQIWKLYTNEENGIKINSKISDRLPMWKTVGEVVKFFKKFKSKNVFSGAKI